MELHNVFGVNVYQMFMDWFNGEFTEMFSERFPEKGMTLVILSSDNLVELEQNWRHPQGFELIVAHIGDEAVATAKDGTYDNVKGKLRFVLRTGLNSVAAETQQDRVRAGDFPWEGAGHHMGYIGGVSGLAKKEDSEMLRICIDKLREMLKEVNTVAMTISDNLRKKPDCPSGSKYLNGINASEAFADKYVA